MRKPIKLYSIIYLFTFLLNSPKANYEVRTNIESCKTNNYTQTKIKQGKVYHLENKVKSCYNIIIIVIAIK
jgi:hypothetical protein